jgi:FkbM family methyltransferase
VRRTSATAAAALIAWQHRVFEPELAHLRELVPPESTAVDVGAWWGPWTYWLARTARQVVTCEPIPELAAFIRRVAPPNVDVRTVALSDRTGDAVLWVPPGRRGSEGRASLETSAPGGRLIQVRTVRLDDLGLTDVGLVKIDVEGHELRVLHGARATIAAQQPVLVVEVEQMHHDGSIVADVFEYLNALGYDGRFLLGGAWHDVSEFDVEHHQLRWQERVRRHGYVWNMVVNARRYVNNFVFTPRSSEAR